MQFFTLEVSKTLFFDILVTHNDQANYVKHVLRSIYVLFGGWVLKEDSLRVGLAEGNRIFLIFWPFTMIKYPM